jgi:hypothetical protein
MTIVDRSSVLSELRKADQAIVLIHFKWSGQSMKSLRVVERLDQILWTNACVYRLDPEEIPEGTEWLVDMSTRYDRDLSGGGFGAVLWLRNGSMVQWERFAAQAGLSELIQKTEDAFTSD